MWNFPLIPDQASSTAARVDAIMLYELGVLVFFTALICVMIIGLAIRYRRGHRVDRSDPPESGKMMEALWIGVPLLLAIPMFVFGAGIFYELFRPPADAFDIYVVGKQWMWYIQHPEGRREINELHLPVGRAVKLKMTSQDVIHSFFVPAFRTKQDVLPGRYTETWFRPTKPGVYHLFCAEYCGTNHSLMRGTVTVMDPAAYERWLDEGYGGPSMAEQGKELFVRHHCAGCHGGVSESVKAPRLEGVYGRPVPIDAGEGREPRFVTADDRYIRDSILLPKSQVVAGYNPIMPSFQGQIPEEDLVKIIEYIKSIGGEAPR
jgi:cytochrome c oxidase subunit 2